VHAGYTNVGVVVVICAALVNTRTHTDRQTDSFLTGYTWPDYLKSQLKQMFIVSGKNMCSNNNINNNNNNNLHLILVKRNCSTLMMIMMRTLITNLNLSNVLCCYWMMIVQQ